MVIDVECGNIPDRVVNIGDDDVWLNPKTRIGILHETNGEHASETKVSSQDTEKIKSAMQEALSTVVWLVRKH